MVVELGMSNYNMTLSGIMRLGVGDSMLTVVRDSGRSASRSS